MILRSHINQVNYKCYEVYSCGRRGKMAIEMGDKMGKKRGLRKETEGEQIKLRAIWGALLKPNTVEAS